MSRVLNMITKETTTKYHSVEIPDNISDEEIGNHVTNILKEKKGDWVFNVEIEPTDILSKYGEVNKIESTTKDGFTITLEKEETLSDGRYLNDQIASLVYPASDGYDDNYNAIESTGIFSIDWGDDLADYSIT